MGKQVNTKGVKWGFGPMLRAYRFRFGVMPNGAGLLRISEQLSGVLCEFQPFGLLPNHLNTGGPFAIWWEKAHGKDVIAASPYLRAIRRVTQPFNVILGEDGMPNA